MRFLSIEAIHRYSKYLVSFRFAELPAKWIRKHCAVTRDQSQRLPTAANFLEGDFRGVRRLHLNE